MVDAPEKLWMTAEEMGWPGSFRSFRMSDLEHPEDEYPAYVRADLYEQVKQERDDAKQALQNEIVAHGNTIRGKAERLADDAVSIVRDRDAWREQAQQAAGVIAMIRAMLGEMFGPVIESEDAALLRGPEPKHDGEAILEALQKIAERLAGARVKVKALGDWRRGYCDDEVTIEQVPTGFGSIYQVRIFEGTIWLDYPVREKEAFPTVEAAKAAAQADYERRILAALAEPAGEAEPVTWQHMPGCGEDRESKMLYVTHKVFCDPCIAPLVAALNTAGIETVASCCGHGHRPGVIALRDGRELFITKDFDEARQVDAIFPIDINGNTRHSEHVVTEEMVERALEAWFDAEVTWDRGMTPPMRARMVDSMRAAINAAIKAQEARDG